MDDIKVTIRFVEEKDAPFIQKYASDKEIAQTSNVPHPYPDKGGEEYVKRVMNWKQKGQSYTFSIICNGCFAGIMSVNGVDKQAGTAELDYWVAVPYWNKGVGTAAASKAIEFAFEDLNLKILRSSCLFGNPASGKVLEKNGFTQIGEVTAKEGKFKGEEGKRFQLLRSDWPKKSRTTDQGQS